MWLFYLYSTVKIRLLYLVFPLAESMAKAFCWLFLWSFKEKASTSFYDTAFFNPKRMIRKCLSHKTRKRNNWRKNSMFSPYCGDETTTPSDRAFRFYPWLHDRKWLMLYYWLCHKKWSILFSLKLQRNNQQNALAIKPVNGTTEEKTVCSHHTVEMKQPRPLTGPSAFILGCTIGNGWCLIFGCAIKNGRYFFPWSPKGITNKIP